LLNLFFVFWLVCVVWLGLACWLVNWMLL